MGNKRSGRRDSIGRGGGGGGGRSARCIATTGTAMSERAIKTASSSASDRYKGGTRYYRDQREIE